MASIADEIEYKLDTVETQSVAANDIDKTFRTTCIGETLVICRTA
jgi:hypothetical protein